VRPFVVDAVDTAGAPITNRRTDELPAEPVPENIQVRRFLVYPRIKQPKTSTTALDPA
jgi:hypothetical protein